MVSQSRRRMAKLRTNSLEKDWSPSRKHRSALVWLGQSCWSCWASKGPLQSSGGEQAISSGGTGVQWIQVCSGIQVSMGVGGLQATQGLQRAWQICVDTGVISRLCAGCRGLWRCVKRGAGRFTSQGCKVLEGSHAACAEAALLAVLTHCRPQPTPGIEGAPLPPALASLPPEEAPSRSLSSAGMNSPPFSQSFC